MTLLEAFKFKAGNGVSDTDASSALQFSGLEPNATWDANSTNCSFYEALTNYLSRDNVGIRSISQGGYSITYDKGEKRKFIYGLALESGCPKLIDKYDPQPKVKDKSYLW